MLAASVGPRCPSLILTPPLSPLPTLILPRPLPFHQLSLLRESKPLGLWA